MNFQADEDQLTDDVFTQAMLEQMDRLHQPDPAPIRTNERVLQHIRFEEVFVVDYSKINSTIRRRYFKNMVPDVSITCCERCCKFFLQDEYEFAYVAAGHCPFCKNVEKTKDTRKVFGSLADAHNNMAA
jgi:hypothetical protein